MTRTKLDTPAFADQSVDSRNIADGTVQAQDVAPGGISADKLSDTLDLSSKTVTLPNTSVANTKLANAAVTLNGTSIALGASGSINIFLDWQAVVVADGSTTLTAQSGKGYFLDTNTGVIEVFLPTSPSRGDVIGLVDYSGTFGTNQLIINTGGVSIDSSITDGSSAGNEYKVITNNSIVELVYVDSAKGWLVNLNQTAGVTPDGVMTNSGTYNAFTNIQATGGTVTTSGDYKIHTFTGDDNFIVSFAGEGSQSNPSIVDYLVVAGGGGGAEPYGGGGGGGGVRESLASASPTHTANTHTASPIKATSGITVTATTYPITVGGGGTRGVKTPGTSTAAGQGSNSVFSTITSTGGGGGGGLTPGTGSAGGSGGGGGSYFPGPYSTGPTSRTTAGNGNTPPVSPSQGNNGGYGLKAPNGVSAGGGGGATAAGQSAGGETPVPGSFSFPNPTWFSTGGDGGAGATTCITGSPVGYGGGAGGATEAYFGGHGYGSPCGSGGNGRYGPNSPADFAATAGATNKGGGGGGGYCGPVTHRHAAAGGKGIVVIRYKFQ